MAALRSIVSSKTLGAVRRAPSAFVVAKRGYAEAASPASDKLRLSLVLPHEVRAGDHTLLFEFSMFIMLEIDGKNSYHLLVDHLQVDRCYPGKSCRVNR